MPALRVFRGQEFDRAHVIPDDTGLAVIGRSATNDICLTGDRSVSRYHAVVVRTKSGDGYFVRDLGSLSSTKVDGRVIYQHLLRDGNEIEVGSYRIIYSNRTPPQLEHRPLRLVLHRSRDSSPEDETILVRHQELDSTKLSANERELMQSLGREARAGTDLTGLLSRMIPAIVAGTATRRGFACFFLDVSGAEFRVIASTGLARSDVIEITTPDYIDLLRSGIAVRESHTLLVPILRGRNAIGFICIERDASAEPFTDRGAHFLLTLGRTATESLPEGQGVRLDDFVAEDRPLEWGVEFVAREASIRAHSQAISRAASDGRNVLVLGDTGTGKGLVAKAIHLASRRDGGFVHFACPEINKEIVETEVFGYAKNAALANAAPEGKASQFELAHNGTLFFDEIHAFNAALQDKLLVVLDCRDYEKKIKRVQGTREIPVSVKIIAATDKNMKAAIESGEFRVPLFHRFEIVINLLPLNERAEDVPLLVHYFLDQWAATSVNSTVRTVSHRALNMLMGYQWPGNVRQLQNVVRAAADRAVGRTVLHSWDFEFGGSGEVGDPARPASPGPRRLPRPMEEVEEEQIKEALEYCDGNKTRVHRLLGYGSRMTLLAKMDKYGIPRDYGEPRA